MLNVIFFVQLIIQSCSDGKRVDSGVQALIIDSLNKNKRINAAPQSSNELKVTTDAINGVWYIFQRFSPVSKDKSINPSTYLIIENGLITKVIDGKVVFIDSIKYVQSTNSYKRYEFKKREKDFLKYSIKHDDINFFIGGDDGSREDYKRKSK